MSTKLAIIAGEPSGDVLGGALLQALNDTRNVDIVGVGGPKMHAQGMQSWFDISDIAVMGAIDVLGALPRLLKRINQVVQNVVSDKDLDALILIDAQDFSKRVARKVRAKRPDLPIILYVAPTVWVWRPMRAQKIKPYIDHLLSLFPHEPEWFKRLNGPPCHYVGHPLTSVVKAEPGQMPVREKPLLLVMPGSRQGELDRHLDLIGETIGTLANTCDFDIQIPTLPKFVDQLQQRTSDWPVSVRITSSETEKYEAIQTARAALVVVGTVTLELGLAQAPMVVMYQPDMIMRRLGFMFTTPYFALPNIILDEAGCPEYMARDIDPIKMARDLNQLLTNDQAYDSQRQFLARLRDKMQLSDNKKPAAEAADIVFKIINNEI